MQKRLQTFFKLSRQNQIQHQILLKQRFCVSQQNSSKSDNNQQKNTDIKEQEEKKNVTQNNEQPESDNEDEIEAQEPYKVERNEDLKSLYNTKYNQDKFIPGFATPEGTLNYSQRNKSMSKSHFKQPFNSSLKLSSIAMGSYAISYDEIDKLVVFNSYIDAVQSGGCNILDTSINSMGMQGERILGSVLRYLSKSQNISRDELFICTKHGKITEDQDSDSSGIKEIAKLVKQGLIEDRDIIDRKCYQPGFLDFQFNKSLENIGIECLDLVYINEPNYPSKGKVEFYDTMAKVFEFYEKKIQDGQLKNYGIDSWQGFRALQSDVQGHLELRELVELAEKVGGPNHSFKWIQFPMSFLMPEALYMKEQGLIRKQKNVEEGKEEQEKSDEIIKSTIFEAASRYNININTKSPLMGGAALFEELDQKIMSTNSISGRHIQFCRSTPSDAYQACVLGTDQEEQLREKLEVLKHDPVSSEEMLKFYKKNKIKLGTISHQDE